MNTEINKEMSICEFLLNFSTSKKFDDFHVFEIDSRFILKKDGSLFLEKNGDPVAIDEEYEKKSILQKAEEIVSGDRAEEYGDMRTSFDNIAKMWSVIVGKEVTARQVGLMMIALKLCRENNKHKEDNLVDCAGYAKCVSML